MTLRIAVCSCFKDSARTLDYFRSVLDHQIGDLAFSFSFVEGDSKDDTWERLQGWARADSRVKLQKRDIQPVRDFQDRVEKWAGIGNLALEGAREGDFDLLAWCENDLALPPDLFAQLAADEVDVVAPAVFLGGMFYDTWGFRGLDGRRFTNDPPYHADFRSHALVELSSAGSLVLFRRPVIEAGIRFRGDFENGLLAGFCQDARKLGFQVWMDSRVAVLHPTSLWQGQQYRLGRVATRAAGLGRREERTLAGIVQRLKASSRMGLGSPDLPPGHPALGVIASRLRRKLPRRRFVVSTRLLSERDKTFELVLEIAAPEDPVET